MRMRATPGKLFLFLSLDAFVKIPKKAIYSVFGWQKATVIQSIIILAISEGIKIEEMFSFLEIKVMRFFFSLTQSWKAFYT